MRVRNQDGQTVVEYILLLVVAISLVTTFYNSDVYKRLFGDKGLLGATYKREAEGSYQHALAPKKQDALAGPGSIADHTSYYNKSKNDTRFFGPKDRYPQ